MVTRLVCWLRAVMRSNSLEYRVLSDERRMEMVRRAAWNWPGTILLAVTMVAIFATATISPLPPFPQTLPSQLLHLRSVAPPRHSLASRQQGSLAGPRCLPLLTLPM